MEPFIVMGIAAATEAVSDSGWAPTEQEDRDRTGVLIGSGIGGLNGIYDTSLILKEKGPRRVSPFFVPGSHQRPTSVGFDGFFTSMIW